MTQETISLLCKTWLQTVLIISITTSIIVLLKEKAIGNENTLRFAVILFAIYAYLCVLVYDPSLTILHNILSGITGAIVVWLFRKKMNNQDKQNDKSPTV